jgi:hypothetical protein
MDFGKNRLQRVVLTALVGGALAACSTTPQRTAAIDEPVDLSGDWVLNQELSDRPSDVLSSVSGTSTSPLDLVRRFGGIISVYGISAAEVASMIPDGEDEAAPEFPAEVTDPMDELTVVQGSDTVEVDYDSTTTVVYQDGEAQSDADQTFFARWQEDAFLVERRPRDGLAFSETFELAADGEQLIWIVTFETPDGDELEITRVYDFRDVVASPSPANAATLASTAAAF